MNKKIVFENAQGKRVFFIVSDKADLKSQLHKAFSVSEGQGLTVELGECFIEIIDYFHADTVARLPVISVTDVTDEPSYVFKEV